MHVQVFEFLKIINKLQTKQQDRLKKKAVKWTISILF